MEFENAVELVRTYGVQEGYKRYCDHQNMMNLNIMSFADFRRLTID